MAERPVASLDDLLDAAPDAMVGVDRSGRLVAVNSQAARLFGYAREELLGHQVEVLVPLRVRRIHPQHRSRYLTNPVPRPMGAGMELAARRKDGSEFPAEISLKAAGRGGDQVVLAAIRDVTERRRAAAKLVGLLDSAPDGIVVVDDGGRIQMVNVQAERLFGYRRDELIGKQVDLLVPQASRRLHPQHRLRYAHDPRPRPMGAGIQLAGRRRDGSEFPADISLSALQTDEGIIVSAAIRDVSDRLAAEAERERLRAQAEQQRIESHRLLEQRVAERTGELAGAVQSLQQADERRRRLLARIVEAQEQERHRIAGDVHDDAVQVMTAVNFRLEVLRRGLTDPEQAEAALQLEETVSLSISRLRSLLFDLSPPALGRGLGDAVHVYLTERATGWAVDWQVVEQLSRQPPSPLRTLLFRICQEALVNVCKHAAPCLAIVLITERDTGILVQVSDTGPGCDEADLLAAEAGHLGVSGMRERADSAGGWCTVTSAPGRGTVVEAWVPLPPPAVAG